MKENNMIKNTYKILADIVIADYISKNGKNSITPKIYSLLGTAAINEQGLDAARPFFIYGAIHGTSWKNVNKYSASDLEHIARCLVNLLTNYLNNGNDFNDKSNEDDVFKISVLTYMFLSYLIEMYENNINYSQYLYAIRGILFQEHKNIFVIFRLINELGYGQLLDPYIIHDYYKASSFDGSDFRELLLKANEIHNDLDCITIYGKDADEYSLKELSDIGEKRHKMLFDCLKLKADNGFYDVKLEEFNKIFNLE